MTTELLDLLLERLSQGDLQAAEQVFMAYEPYLRMIVRRSLSDRLRAKLDSIDVVQSVWVHVVQGLHDAGWQCSDRHHLQALLVTLARRRLVSSYRHHRPALEREHRGRTDLDSLPSLREPRASEVAQAEELWEKMLTLCPPAHHEVLQLRRQGLLLEEIAVRTGLHEGSIRRILRRLARQLALKETPVPAGWGAVS